MREAFDVREDASGGRKVILFVSGHLDARSTPLLLQHCQRVREDGRDLVLNLAEVGFIASSGIGGLLAVTQEFRDAGLDICFTALSPAVQSVLQLLNLDQFLSIEEETGEGRRAAGM
jgi:anti-anti-sigma factor